MVVIYDFAIIVADDEYVIVQFFGDNGRVFDLRQKVLGKLVPLGVHKHSSFLKKIKHCDNYFINALIIIYLSSHQPNYTTIIMPSYYGHS